MGRSQILVSLMLIAVCVAICAAHSSSKRDVVARHLDSNPNYQQFLNESTHINSSKCLEFSWCLYKCNGHFMKCVGSKASNEGARNTSTVVAGSTIKDADANAANTSIINDIDPFWSLKHCAEFLQCTLDCWPHLEVCLGIPGISNFDQGDRVDFKLETFSSDQTFKIQNAFVTWGKLYERHPEEVHPSIINSKKFYKSNPTSFGACGRQSSFSGTEGSFEVFHENDSNFVSRYHFDVSYGVGGPGKPDIRQVKNRQSKYNCELIQVTFNNFFIECSVKA